ncbi:MAG TPA: TetR family transcriptional regulator C-terminal domain-containing protein [Archangium sp.]|uniref:TetR/AcrR family transcriptional regulator n=1 Tax=Archangium sp. TaxID=1872627 RepID=UPI002E34DA67|nr:TetR family transcriptional regulator C-terminal domain-containing protein [Archangium sp.]HEX5748819.1 TetR family transcriptional regulator C-terminal domain-containing protein [Archangium sp.]
MSGTGTRQKLLHEGLRLLLREGYSATGIKRIVDAADVPKGSFYHFFPDGKEDFALGVVELYAELAAQTRRELLLEGAGPPLQRLRRYFLHYAAYFEGVGFREGCLLGNLSAEVSDVSDNLRAKIQSAFAAWEVDLEQVVREAMDKGEVRPLDSPRRIARHLIHGWEGALLRMKAEKNATAMDDFIAMTFDAWLTGLEAQD